MKMWKLGGFGLAMWLASNATARAQAIPGAVAPPPPPPPAAAAGVAPAAAGGNIFSKICLTPEQKAACKEKLCKMKLIQLMNNSLAPASALTGGIIGGCCPLFPASDLLKPATSAEGAAARIKKDEAEAKARREAVRFLGTVDCRYWPEAQEALINGLRADRNECVRWEAAMSLGRGCCCTKPTIKALIVAISCSNEDGNPIEKSPRVRAAARAALERCVACYLEVNPVPPEEKPVETPEGPKEKESLPPPGTGKGAAPGITQVSAAVRSQEYYERVKSVPRSRLIAEARKVLEKNNMPVIESDVPPAGSRSVFEVISHVVNPSRVQPGESYEVMPSSMVVKDAVKAPPTTARVDPPLPTPTAPPPMAKPSERLVPQTLPPSVKTPAQPALPTSPSYPTRTPSVKQQPPAPSPYSTLKPVGATSGMNSPVMPALSEQPAPTVTPMPATSPVPPASFSSPMAPGTQPAPLPQYRPAPRPTQPAPAQQSQTTQPRRSRVGRPVIQNVQPAGSGPLTQATTPPQQIPQ